MGLEGLHALVKKLRRVREEWIGSRTGGGVIREWVVRVGVRVGVVAHPMHVLSVLSAGAHHDELSRAEEDVLDRHVHVACVGGSGVGLRSGSR
jgi:hypothetical protein